MKCHYEVLNVERDASESEIRVAYRKLALQWHPDKNLDNPIAAKEHFQLVQQAYEVLSDPQERAWYDKHREQIIRGKNSDYEENCLDLFQYFTVSCFKGYGDDPGGFYQVYADVFEKLAAEDAEFMEDEEDIAKIPKFGDSKSSYEDVVGPFYAYWQSYCTKRSYTWLCPYDITEIKDRRVLREVEKDLKKIVQKAKKERNEEVRNLVSFVRKRDKRVQANKKLLEERAALNRQKQEQNRLEQIRKRKQEVEEMQKSQGQSMIYQGYEEQLRQLENEYGNSEDESDYDSEDLAEDADDLDLEEAVYLDDLYCVACNRTFKNEKAFLNHETSKKHKDNVEKLKLEMQEEEREFEENAESDEDELENGEKDDPGSCDKDEAKNENKAEELKEQPDDVEEELIRNPSKKDRKKSKKPTPQRQIESDEDSPTDLPDFLSKSKSDASDDDWKDDKKSSKKAKNKKQKQLQQPPKKLNGVKVNKEQAEAVDEAPSKSKPEQETTSTADFDHVCVTCHSSFDSKNKLFTHLKKTNHGVYIPKKGARAAAAEVSTGRKGKKK